MKKKLTSLVAFGLLCGFCCSSHAMNVAIPENPTAMRSLLVGISQHQVMAVDDNKNVVFWEDPGQVVEAGDVQSAIFRICGAARLGRGNDWLHGGNAALRINLSGSIAALLNCYQMNPQGVLAQYAQVALGAGNPLLPAAAAGGSVMAEYVNFAPLFDAYVGQQGIQAFTVQGLTAFLAANLAAHANWTQEVVEYLVVQYISETAEHNSLLGVVPGGAAAASGWDDAMIDLLAITLNN